MLSSPGEQKRSAASESGGTKQSLVDSGCEPHPPHLYDHSDLATPRAFTDEDLVRNYDRDGFIVIEDAFSKCIREIHDALDRLCTGNNSDFGADVCEVASRPEPPDFTTGDRIPWVQYEAGTPVDVVRPLQPQLTPKIRKLMGFSDYEPAIRAIVKDARLVHLVSRLLDCPAEELHLFQDMSLLKPPRGGREKPWHQDKAFFNIGAERQVVGCWIAVNEATLENACLRMQRGGHLLGPLHHFADRDYQICDTNSPCRDDVVAVPLRPGGLVLFDGMTPHGTPTNSSDKCRKALQFHWVRRGVEMIKPDEPNGRTSVFGGDANGASC
uniref:Fe2OG dioxygenase domain-containing protein n=1 Tax=Odontella aurita TaxID=265563 RepID=A0A7S4NHZ6_9STRA|mmetsp:Transcript_7295/g.21561  ORF Transcript_7295/g.21561 Transcript_7295/m.21561 type:complete len:326 (+) Transcript_7295:134-1111(+)